MPAFAGMTVERNFAMNALTEVVTPKAEAGKSAAAAKRKPDRHPSQGPASLRYFLAKDQSSSPAPQFGKELANENEALIESVRSGLAYYVVSEWRAVPDLSGRTPQIIKQAVARPPA
jgi:hypothetical protein